MSPEERVEVLALIAVDADEIIARRAAETLLSQQREAFLTALAKPQAAPALFSYCSKQMPETPGIADALVNNPNCPAELLVPAARHMTTAGVQTLVENLERLCSVPALAAALVASPSLTAEQRFLLQELQQDTADPAAFQDAVADAGLDPRRRQTLLQKLARMPVVERVRLAFRGNQEDRRALIRDPCKVVQVSVLQSPLITEREVEGYSSMTNVSDDVLRYISLNRKFRKNYSVVHNLVNNPKTPLDVSLHLLPIVNSQDLKLLTLNKNIPETLRMMATRLHRQRQRTAAQQKPSG